ncbi:MAG: nuclear transport factor 2 family protein, partial [Candidatus Binatia bacterium]
TDALLDHADARLALAAALRTAGRGGEADAEQRRATELWETKGATLLADRVRRDESCHGSVARVEPRIESVPAPPRRVRANAATATTAQFDAAFASGGLAAIESTFIDSPDVHVVDHPTASVYGREGAIDSFRRLLRLQDPVVRHEPLATLGDCLGLFRRRISAGGTAGGRFDVGDYEREEFVVVEPGVVIEIFAADHLGAAIARLYEQYAELLPEGSARQRAALTARVVAYTLTDSTTPDEALLFSPTYEDVDHRSVGYGALSTDEARNLVVTQRALADGLRFHVEDILALRPDGLVRTTTTTGTWRDGGGAFERTVCMLSVFGPDGRAVRQETFDSDREAEALARFDELTAAPARADVARRVRPNAASAMAARIEAAFAARDLEAVDALLGESMESVDHQTGTAYGREGHLDSSRRMMRLPDLVFRLEVLATLGDRLCLLRRAVSASGTAGGNFDVAEYEMEHVGVLELDAAGRCGSFETFAPAHFGAAVVRFYQRYAESLPAGPARERAAATARSLQGFDGLVDPEGWAATMAPDIEQVDHRTLSTWSAHGRDAVLAHLRSLREVAGDSSVQSDDLLAASPDVLLYRGTHTGTDLRGGGRYERAYLCLTAMAPDGRVARVEFFDADREAEALARFDELVGRHPSAAPPQLFANAATGFNQRLGHAWAARDWGAVSALHASTVHMEDRRRLMQMRVTADDAMTQLRVLFDVPGSRFVITPLATRGERLALSRLLFEGNVDAGGGPLAIDYLALDEVDAAGRSSQVVLFDADDLAAAYAELDARFEAGEGAASPAHGVVMRAFAAAVVSRDWDRVVALCAPTFVEYDHRGLAVLGTTHGGAAWAQNFRTLTDLAPDTVYRVDHARPAAQGFCAVGTWHGTRDGGPYEVPLIAVIELTADGQMRQADIYDLDHADQALARFAQLDAGAAAPREGEPPGEPGAGRDGS